MSVSLISHRLKLAIKIIRRLAVHPGKHVAIDIHRDPNVAMPREFLLIDKSPTTYDPYDPTFIRGRARLLTQKAEAYHGLNFIDESVAIAEEALTFARSIGANKSNYSGILESAAQLMEWVNIKTVVAQIDITQNLEPLV